LHGAGGGESSQVLLVAKIIQNNQSSTRNKEWLYNFDLEMVLKFSHSKVASCYEMLNWISVLTSRECLCSMGLKDEDKHVMVIIVRTRSNYAYLIFILEG
jgi:hypothetical protein